MRCKVFGGEADGAAQRDDLGLVHTLDASSGSASVQVVPGLNVCGYRYLFAQASGHSEHHRRDHHVDAAARKRSPYVRVYRQTNQQQDKADDDQGNSDEDRHRLRRLVWHGRRVMKPNSHARDGYSASSSQAMLRRDV